MIFFRTKDELQKTSWDKLHKKDYHPSVQDSIKRITDHKTNNSWLFDRWSKTLKIDNIDVKNKTVLEIGFGGGWFLAQMLFRNASKVIGFEISETIITKAQEIFKQLNLKNYEFYEVDENFLNVIPKNSVDIIFEMTVFQHIFPEATKNYLQSAKNILKNNGTIFCQFLMNDANPSKNPCTKKRQGVVYYSHLEILDLISECGFKVENFGDYDWTDGNNSYWRIYAFKNI